MNKQKEILELKKLYLIQFEKFETKVFLSWLTIFFGVFIAWIYRRIDGWIVILLALATMILDIMIDSWRKKSFNKVANEIKKEDFGEI